MCPTLSWMTKNKDTELKTQIQAHSFELFMMFYCHWEAGEVQSGVLLSCTNKKTVKKKRCIQLKPEHRETLNRNAKMLKTTIKNLFEST